MSRRARHRRDRRAEAAEFLALDAQAEPDDDPDPTEFTDTTGQRIDLRAPWVLPTRNETRTTEP